MRGVDSRERTGLDRDGEGLQPYCLFFYPESHFPGPDNSTLPLMYAPVFGALGFSCPGENFRAQRQSSPMPANSCLVVGPDVREVVVMILTELGSEKLWFHPQVLNNQNQKYMGTP